MNLELKIKNSFTTGEDALPPPRELADEDEEANEEIGAFYGMLCSELNASFWDNHYCALYFFTDSEYRYYLPSVMLLSLRDYHSVQKAISVIIYDLSDESRGRLGSKCLGKLNESQLECVSSWLDNIRLSTENYGMANEIQAASFNVNSLRGSKMNPRANQ